MHPCFRGLVLNVVLDVFLPLIGVWLQGERWQLGETALPLMNSSSSILPKRPVDTAFLPVNKDRLSALSLALMDNHHCSEHSSPLHWVYSCPHSHSYDLRFLHFRVVSFALFLNSPLVVFPESVFTRRASPSSANYWLSPMKWRPCCLLCSWATKGHYLGSGMSLGRVDEEMRLGLFRGCAVVKVRGFNCSFAKGSPIRSI